MQQAVATYPINGMTLNKELSDKQMTGIGEADDPMFTIRANGTQHAVATQQPVPFVKAKRAHSADDDETWEVDRPAPTINTFRATVAIAFHHNAQACQLPSEHRDTSVTDTLTVSQNAAVATSLAVRRLTPRECERLQGFPDDYTAIAYRGKPAADGPRYKAMGNSMAVNCMAWIGERIAAVNARIEAALEVQP
jgi:DNA (cytosine-5)-methyltransferase 1